MGLWSLTGQLHIPLAGIEYAMSNYYLLEAWRKVGHVVAH